MSMFSITGQVMNLFHQPGAVDPETGEVTKGRDKVQVLGEIPVEGGDIKMDMVTLSIPEGLDFKPYLQKKVTFPLGIFAPAKGKIVYFIPKGSKIGSFTPAQPATSQPTRAA